MCSNLRNCERFAIWQRIGFKSNVETQWSHLKLISEYCSHNFPNYKVTTAKNHGRHYIKFSPLLVLRHFLLSFIPQSFMLPDRKRETVKEHP